jgi:intracellular sulfur oxidation DsrE/DsrF family protein
MKKNYIFIAIVFLTFFGITAQEKKAGPIIADYGKVWEINNQDYKIEKNQELKVVFDIMNSPKDTSALNRSIETAARFLNMHAQSGVALENMKVALVVHNKASKDISTNEAYKDKYGVNNPNAEMVQQLMDAGVAFIFCGQSSLSRDFPIEETIPGVQLSLSAMTALIQLQNDGYRLIKF